MHNFKNTLVFISTLFFQNFDALLLQILVLTLFCPHEERSIEDGPLLNIEESGPKLVDLFTPEFCLKVGDTFVKTLKSEDTKSPAVNQWLQQQKRGEVEPLTHLVSDLIEQK